MSDDYQNQMQQALEEFATVINIDGIEESDPEYQEARDEYREAVATVFEENNTEISDEMLEETVGADEVSLQHPPKSGKYTVSSEDWDETYEIDLNEVSA